MKSPLKRMLFNGAVVSALFLGSLTAQAADEDRTYTVAEGASPWFDRVGQWSLTNVPEDLKNLGPLPQGDCSSRSLEIPGRPASIIVGVQTNDAAKFIEMFPGAKDTGTQIAVKNPAGVTLPYLIFKLANPPEKIDGAGTFGAGLLLLKS